MAMCQLTHLERHIYENIYSFAYFLNSGNDNGLFNLMK